MIVSAPKIAQMLEHLAMIKISQQSAEHVLKQIKEVAATETVAIRNALLKGSTTGDAVLDLAIMAGHDPGSSLVGKFREVEKMLAGKVGQLILVSYSSEVRTRGGMGGDRYRWANCFRAGLLEAETLVLCGHGRGILRGVDVAVSRHVQGERPFVPLGYPVNQGSLFDQLTRSPAPQPLWEFVDRDMQWARRLLVGDKAVEAWFASHMMSGAYSMVLKCLHEAAAAEVAVA